MNTTRNRNSLQLALDIESETQMMDTVGSPAVLDPWVSPRGRLSLEDAIVVSGQVHQVATNVVRPAVPFQQPMTARQRGFLVALAREKGWTDSDVLLEVNERFGETAWDNLDRWQASELIRVLQEREPVPVAS